ncbi:MAG: hypothetical protein JW915_23645 [Chitinispirillaceae bacterium]|nr:hypothetical protein [Chitinispirillaceae bacterium]
MDPIKVRPLKLKDRKTISDLIQKLAEKIGNDQLLNIIDSTVSDAAVEATEEQKIIEKKKMISFAVNVLKQIFDVLDNDVKLFLADLINCPVVDFDEQPFDVEVQILEQIIEKPEFSSFFTGASQLVSKIQLLKNG